jgi:hypothetical protein
VLALALALEVLALDILNPAGRGTRERDDG